MKGGGIIVGVAASLLLLALLGLTRLLVPVSNVEELEIREVEITATPEPPPPPPDEPPPDAPPPPPALTSVDPVPDVTRVPIPKAEVPLDLSMPVDPFFTDIAPSPLPQPAPVQRPSTPSPRPAPPAPKPAPRAAPPAVVKSHYDMSELDGKPRLLRAGSATFPSALARRGVSSGTVVLEVELSERGSVRVRRTLSSSHPELVSAAQRVAAGSRFTPPMKSGRAVKAVMRWPITIKR